MKDFSDEKDALVKDEQVLAGIDGAATVTGAGAPTAGTPLDTVKTKLTAAYGANGTKAAPAGGTGKALADEQAKLPNLKTAVEDAKKAVTALEEAKKAFDADKDTAKTNTLAALNTAAKAVDNSHTDWTKDDVETKYAGILEKAQGAVTDANDAVTAQNKTIAEKQAAHDKAEAELNEARKGALLDYAASLEKTAATAKTAIPEDTTAATYLAAKLAYNAAKSGHDVAKAIDTAKTALEGEKTKQKN